MTSDDTLMGKFVVDAISHPFADIGQNSDLLKPTKTFGRTSIYDTTYALESIQRLESSTLLHYRLVRQQTWL